MCLWNQCYTGLLPAYFSLLQWILLIFFFLFIFRYSYLSPLQIKQIPVPKLAAPSCLIVTWVTNRQKHLRFVKEELYPSWSVEVVAEWHWVKVSPQVNVFVNFIYSQGAMYKSRKGSTYFLMFTMASLYFFNMV